MNNKTYTGLILLCIIYSLNSMVEAQSFIHGIVTDKTTSETIIGALIECNGVKTITESNGSFRLEITPESNFLTVQYPGYNRYIKKLSLIPNHDLEFNIELEQSNILLDIAEISSSRFEKPIAESPISIDVIKPIMAERLNSSSADQVIDRVPGIQIIDGQANIRGGSGFSYGAGSRVMLVMDDLQILQPDAGFTNWTDLPLENVGQIEIVKGAASALYGSAAMNGIIHFRTIKPSLEPYTSIGLISRVFTSPKGNSQWWGSDHNNNIIPSNLALTFAHRKKFKKYDLTLGSMYRNDLSYNKNSNSENLRLDGSLVKHFSDRLIAGLGFNINSGNSQSFFYWDSEGSYNGDINSYSSSKKLRFNIDPSIQYISSKNYKHRILTRWLHIDNNNDNNQSNTSDNIFTEYQLQKEISNLGLTFSTGVLINYYAIKAPLYGDTTYKSNNIASYIQIEKSIYTKLKLSGGVRYEYNRLNGPYYVDGNAVTNPESDDQPVYRLGLNYRIAMGTYFRASFGQGFRFPTLAEKYIHTNAGGFNIVPNVKLHSEYGNSYEIGLKQGIKLGNYQGLFDFSLFYSKYQDMVEFTLVIDKNFSAKYQAQNVGDTKILGGEITNQGILDFGKSKFIYNAGITLLDPKFQEWDISGKDIPINKQDSITKGQKNA
ncbi:MAG: TonB-dependent receptor, partial [Saprospiraceae bacterium]